MNRTILLEMIRNGENSSVEFKRDDVHRDSIAKEFSALLNLEGGYILLGVEDNGFVSGLTRSREDAERWVMNIAHQNIQPSFIPSWSPIPLDDGKVVGVIELPAASPGKPHKARQGSAWVTFMRVGSTSREASREEEGRLYQAAHLMRYDIRPVLDTAYESLDQERLENYFRIVLDREAPARNDHQSWCRTLTNIDILAEAAEATVTTAAGLLLFGEYPNRRLPQAGITATAFPREEKDYDTIDEELIRGPLVSLLSAGRRPVDKGVIDRAVDFVDRNLGTVAWLEGGRRLRKKELPLDAVREAIVNAVAHRDYTLISTDVEVSLYQDRLEVISPGRLPNGVTVKKMAEGLRAARNELLKEILRDYGYVDHLGMGVRNKIIGSMRTHNGTRPDLIEDENRFTVRLWKNPNAHESQGP